MKVILFEKYQCEFCNEIFDKKWQCELHEKENHMCPKCEHSYYVYGCELNCALRNDGKSCRFKEKKK